MVSGQLGEAWKLGTIGIISVETLVLLEEYSFFADKRILNLSPNIEPRGDLSLGRCKNTNCGDAFFIR